MYTEMTHNKSLVSYPGDSNFSVWDFQHFEMIMRSESREVSGRENRSEKVTNDSLKNFKQVGSSF